MLRAPFAAISFIPLLPSQQSIHLSIRRRVTVVRDDFMTEMRKHVVNRELDHLRIDEQKAQRLWRVTINETRDQRIDANRFARARGAGNEQGAASSQDRR